MPERKRHTLSFNPKGDKVIWIIVFMLIMISIVCIFSSTSRLLGSGQTRIDMVWDQMKTVVMGIVVILVCYWIRNLNFYRNVSRWAFIASLLILLFLILGPKEGFIHSAEINGARRVIAVGKMQVFVYEIIKVLMVMYMAWATESVQSGKLILADRLTSNPNLKWFSTPRGKRFLYIYLPFLVIVLLTLPGSGSAAIFIGAIMLITLAMGGESIKSAALLVLLGMMLFGAAAGTYKLSDGKLFGRMETILGRFKSDSVKDMEAKFKASSGEQRQKIADKMRQPYSALIAVKEGGPLGKGPGQSTQRYVVPDISEDYMFSFIIEEYGLWGAAIVIFLYVSLLARGSLVAQNCGDDIFATTAVAGLTLLITLQAFLHMFVNVDVGPMTGQTLPLISHGTSAFLCFSVVFGILLSISRIAQQKIETEENAAEPLVKVDDTVGSSLGDLDNFESQI
ncbi:MAG: FtsW/RodA/SpoVE family cell cycle protein [Bacteroidales bacterium]|nr:FtsW/RodA/SpoVE family cell cycle protein [Bacteroidales bacterium]